jgi:hypothetical protein
MKALTIREGIRIIPNQNIGGRSNRSKQGIMTRSNTKRVQSKIFRAGSGLEAFVCRTAREMMKRKKPRTVSGILCNLGVSTLKPKISSRTPAAIETTGRSFNSKPSSNQGRGRAAAGSQQPL